MEGIAGGVHQKLDAVNYKIAIKQVTEELDAVKQWSAEHPKSLNVAKLLSDAEQAVNSNAELSIIKSKTSLAVAEYQNDWRNRLGAMRRKAQR